MGQVSRRVRSISRHATAVSEPENIQWACEKQRLAFEASPHPLCISGGFGSAKTWAICLKIIFLSHKYPGFRSLIARKIWEELRQTTMQTFFKVCKPELYDKGRRSDSEKTLEFNNGSRVLWMHLDNVEEGILRGLEINAFFIDQAEEIDEDVFDTLMARLGRWDKAEVPPSEVEAAGGIEAWKWKNPVTGRPIPPSYAMIACNPDTELHWIYRRFHPESRDRRMPRVPLLKDDNTPVVDSQGEAVMISFADQGYRMIQVASWENKFLPSQNLQMMLAKDETFRRRFVEGEWGIPEGQIHYADKSSFLVTDRKEAEMGAGVYVEPLEFLRYIRGSCTVHRSYDHGDSSPACCLWWAVDRDGNLICFQEYYKGGALISEHRQTITELSASWTIRSSLADPSIFHKLGQKEGGKWSVHDEFLECRTLPRHTVIAWQKADNNELGTRNRINEYLTVDKDHVHPITRQKGSPRLFFLMASPFHPQGCFESARQLQMQRREKIGTVDGKPTFSDDRDDEIVDHAYDPIRYFVASRPPLAIKQSAEASHNSFDEVARRLDSFLDRGGHRRLANRLARARRAKG